MTFGQRFGLALLLGAIFLASFANLDSVRHEGIVVGMAVVGFVCLVTEEAE